MTVGRWILVALAIVAAGGAMAQDKAEAPPFDESAYPPEVRKALQSARDDCKDGGGERVTFAPDTVRTLDLTGDRRDDYIVRLRDARCDGAEFVFCGTGGCDFAIIVTLKDGGHRTMFSDRLRDYDILPGKGAKRIRF